MGNTLKRIDKLIEPKDSRIFSDHLNNDLKGISTSKRVSESGKFLDEMANVISEIWHGFAEFIANVTKIWSVVKVKDPDSEKTHDYVVSKKTLEAFNISSNIKKQTQPQRDKIALKIFNINEKIINFNNQAKQLGSRSKLTNLVNFAHSSSMQRKLFEDDTYYTGLMTSLNAYERKIDEITQQILESNFKVELKKSELNELKRKFEEFNLTIISEFTKPIEEQKRLIEEYDQIDEQLKKTSKEIVEAELTNYSSKVKELTQAISNSKDEVQKLNNLKLDQKEVEILESDCKKLSHEFECLKAEVSLLAVELTPEERSDKFEVMERIGEIHKTTKDKLELHKNKPKLIKEYEAKIAASRLELAQLNSKKKVEEISRLHILKDAFENQVERNSKLDEANGLHRDLLTKRTKMLGLRTEQEDKIDHLETELETDLINQNKEIYQEIAKLNSSQDKLGKLDFSSADKTFNWGNGFIL